MGDNDNYKIDPSIMSEIFFNNTHTAIAILDKEFNFIRVNELYAQADNRLVSDFPGHNHFEFYPGDEVESIFRNVVETGKIYQTFSRPFVYPENPERCISYWDWTLVPVKNSKGDVEILIFTLVNVTEHKRKEIELEQFFELSHDLLCVVDCDFVIKRVNQSIENTLGYSKNEIVGARVIDYVHPGDTYAVLSEFNKLFKSNLPMINSINRFRCKDDTYKWIEWSNVPNPEERVVYAIGRDITERKEMEETIRKSKKVLQQSERMYRMLAENATDVIWTTDLNLHITYVSPSVQRLLGYSVEEFMSLTIEDLLTPDSLKIITILCQPEIYAKERGCDKPYRLKAVELKYRRKDNSTVWAEVQLNFLHNSNPQPIGILGVSRDITERKKTEEALDWELKVNITIAALSSKLLSKTAIEDISSQALKHLRELTGSRYGFAGFVEPRTGQFVYVSTAKEDTHPEKSAVFSKFDELWDWVLSNRQHLLTNSPETDPRFSGFSHEQIPHSFLAAPAIINDTLVGIIALADSEREYNERDLALVKRMATIYAAVVKRNHVEEDLIKSEERYRNLFETMVQGVIYYDAEGKIISANPAAESILGITLEQIQGRTLPDLRWKMVHEDGSNLAVEMYPSMIALTTGQAVKDIIMGIFHPTENDCRWINITAVPQLRPGEKKPYQIYTTFHDITEKKQALDELINARKRTEVAQRMASLGNMAAGVAHEINQPLNAIKIIVDSVLYLHEIGKNLSLEVILQKLEYISKQVDRIDSVIRHMKTLMRNDPLDLTACDLNSAVEGALGMLNAQLSSHGILVNRKLKDELPMVTAEQCGLEKVILNLVINAMQALDEAGKEKKEITIATFVEQDVVLEISDNAKGIDEEIVDKIFDPFFTTKEVGQGMGLGLSIVLSTVTLFQGKISVRNNERGGATFRVEFQ